MSKLLNTKLTPLIGFGIFLLIAACSTPPVKEINAAKKSVVEAKSVNATKHAPKELRDAQFNLTRAQELMKKGDNDLARKHAIESKAIGDKAYFMSKGNYVDTKISLTKKAKQASALNPFVKKLYANDIATADKLMSEAEKEMAEGKKLNTELAKSQIERAKKKK